MGLKFILNHHENLAKKLRKLTAGLLAPIFHLFKQGQREHRLLIWYQIRLFCTEWCTQDLKGYNYLLMTNYANGFIRNMKEYYRVSTKFDTL